MGRAAVCALVIAAVIGGAVASAQQGPPAPPPGLVFEWQYDEVVPGRTELFSGRCVFGDDVTVAIIQGGVTVAGTTVATQADDSFSGSIDAPTNLADGEIGVTATCGGESITLVFRVCQSRRAGPGGGSGSRVPGIYRLIDVTAG